VLLRSAIRYGLLHEWHFRSYLDHYTTAFGMLFALNYR
jgi:hypothetical protein